MTASQGLEVDLIQKTGLRAAPAGRTRQAGYRPVAENPQKKQENRPQSLSHGL
jgi:hypothetical protein